MSTSIQDQLRHLIRSKNISEYINSINKNNSDEELDTLIDDVVDDSDDNHATALCFTDPEQSTIDTMGALALTADEVTANSNTQRGHTNSKSKPYHIRTYSMVSDSSRNVDAQIADDFGEVGRLRFGSDASVDTLSKDVIGDGDGTGNDVKSKQRRRRAMQRQASIALRDNMRELMTCPVCLELYLGKHVPLHLQNCAHTICTQCYKGLWKTRGDSRCPICRSKVELAPKAAQKNIQLRGIVELYRMKLPEDEVFSAEKVRAPREIAYDVIAAAVSNTLAMHNFDYMKEYDVIRRTMLSVFQQYDEDGDHKLTTEQLSNMLTGFANIDLDTPFTRPLPPPLPESAAVERGRLLHRSQSIRYSPLMPKAEISVLVRLFPKILSRNDLAAWCSHGVLLPKWKRRSFAAQGAVYYILMAFINGIRRALSKRLNKLPIFVAEAEAKKREEEARAEIAMDSDTDSSVSESHDQNANTTFERGRRKRKKLASGISDGGNVSEDVQDEDEPIKSRIVSVCGHPLGVPPFRHVTAVPKLQQRLKLRNYVLSSLLPGSCPARCELKRVKSSSGMRYDLYITNIVPEFPRWMLEGSDISSESGQESGSGGGGGVSAGLNSDSSSSSSSNSSKARRKAIKHRSRRLLLSGRESRRSWWRNE